MVTEHYDIYVASKCRNEVRSKLSHTLQTLLHSFIPHLESVVSQIRPT